MFAIKSDMHEHALPFDVVETRAQISKTPVTMRKIECPAPVKRRLGCQYRALIDVHVSSVQLDDKLYTCSI